MSLSAFFHEPFGWFDVVLLLILVALLNYCVPA